MMSGLDGFEFLAELTRRGLDTPVVMMTGYSTVDIAVRSLATPGTVDFMSKPFTSDELTIEPRIAAVDEERCSACLNCLEVCPFSAIDTVEKDGRLVARVQQSLCTGCGNCASTCRVRAIEVSGFKDDQIYVIEVNPRASRGPEAGQ